MVIIYLICKKNLFRPAVNNRDMVAANNAIMKVNNLDQLSYDSTIIKRVKKLIN